MLNFGASKPRVKGGPGPPLDPRLPVNCLMALQLLCLDLYLFNYTLFCSLHFFCFDLKSLTT